MTLSKVEPALMQTAGFMSTHTRMATVIEYTNERECAKCHVVKPLSEFYPRPGTKYVTSECKECMKARSRNQVSVDKKVALVPSEADVISELHRRGTPALPGKALHQQWADVIAFGCVLIEVKSSELNHRGSFNFAFTQSQRNGRLRGDLVVLVCKHGDGENTFHVFAANETFFYGDDGKLKTAVSWTPDRGRQGRPTVLSDKMMEYARNRWELVDDYLVKIQSRLKSGQQLPIKLNAA